MRFLRGGGSSLSGRGRRQSGDRPAGGDSDGLSAALCGGRQPQEDRSGGDSFLYGYGRVSVQYTGAGEYPAQQSGYG